MNPDLLKQVIMQKLAGIPKLPRLGSQVPRITPLKKTPPVVTATNAKKSLVAKPKRPANVQAAGGLIRDKLRGI